MPGQALHGVGKTWLKERPQGSFRGFPCLSLRATQQIMGAVNRTTISLPASKGFRTPRMDDGTADLRDTRVMQR